ncbi:MAG: DUF1700 domain-containing protein [Halanaerobiaceae bacterium]|nr:DUF1700 domain-containing protein [Halanaerobiaceae bacterium]
MTRNEFLESLRKELSSLPPDELEDILYDFEEHFNIGLEKGQSEEEITKKLGDPARLARSYRAISVIEEVNKNPTASNIFRAIFSVLSLGFFNLVFMLGPYLGILGVLLALFVSAIVIIAAGIFTVFAPFLSTIFPDIIITGNISAVALILSGIGVSSLGILLFIFDIFIGKKIFSGTVRYLNWNLDILKNGMKNS